MTDLTVETFGPIENYLPEKKKKMNNKEFMKIVDDTFAEVKKLSKLKGNEYSSDVDRLANFRKNGETLGLPQEVIWAVYSNKHHDALMTYIRDVQTGTKRERLEGIEGRIDDLIVYLLLFKGMVKERDA